MYTAVIVPVRAARLCTLMPAREREIGDKGQKKLIFTAVIVPEKRVFSDLHRRNEVSSRTLESSRMPLGPTLPVLHAYSAGESAAQACCARAGKRELES